MPALICTEGVITVGRFWKFVNNLLFADDIDLFAESPEDLRELVDSVNACGQILYRRLMKERRKSCPLEKYILILTQYRAMISLSTEENNLHIYKVS